MSSEIIAAIIASSASFLIGCFTYYKTQQLKFFDAYFNKKAEAYSKYISAVVKRADQDLNMDEVYTCFLIAIMYCSEEAKLQLKATCGLSAQCSSESLKPLVHTLNDAVEIFRKDLQTCRKHKFE